MSPFARAKPLDLPYWELLTELVVLGPWPIGDVAYSPQVMESLLEAEKWDILGCWTGVVWMVWPPETEGRMEDLESVMTVLFRQQPTAVQELTQWMERWNSREGSKECVFKVFQRICRQAHEASQQDLP